jgi:sugar phosphate isomerase/epimerase
MGQTAPLSIATDFRKGTGSPEYSLHQISQAGFTHIHWCHHSATDFYYSHFEINQIGSWLHKYNLQLLDLHGPLGIEKNWIAKEPYVQLAGIELVKNRIDMTEALGGKSVIMHMPAEPSDQHRSKAYWRRVQYALDTLMPYAQTRHVQIALENLYYPKNNFLTLQQIFKLYPSPFLGLCYDSGHGNILEDGVLWLEKLKDRLLAVHLNDNHGKKDEHLPIYHGTVNWSGVARILSQSSYRSPLTLEIQMKNTAYATEDALLQESYRTGTLLTTATEKCLYEGSMLSERDNEIPIIL